MSNREIAEAFAAQFSPPLGVTEVHNIDGRPSPGAFMAADGPRALTAFAHGNGSLAVHFDRPDAAALGRAIAGTGR